MRKLMMLSVFMAAAAFFSVSAQENPSAAEPAAQEIPVESGVSSGVNGDLHAEKTGSSEFQRPVVAGFFLINAVGGQREVRSLNPVAFNVAPDKRTGEVHRAAEEELKTESRG